MGNEFDARELWQSQVPYFEGEKVVGSQRTQLFIGKYQMRTELTASAKAVQCASAVLAAGATLNAAARLRAAGQSTLAATITCRVNLP